MALVAIILGGIQFARTSALSVRQPFVEQQMQLCLKASEHAARLASTHNPQVWATSYEEFWMLYWGPLAVVEDVETTTDERSPVEAAMVRYGALLKPLGVDNIALPATKLEQSALRISNACERSLSSLWSLGLFGWHWF